MQMGFGTWLSRNPRPADEPIGTELSIAVAREPARTRVRLNGELDLSNTPAVAERLAELESEMPAVLEIDLRGLTFMDSSGLAELFAANRRARDQDRRIVIVKDHGPIERLLNLACVEDVMDVVEQPVA
jgi:anti-anti-sigma factor